MKNFSVFTLSLLLSSTVLAGTGSSVLSFDTGAAYDPDARNVSITLELEDSKVTGTLVIKPLKAGTVVENSDINLIKQGGRWSGQIASKTVSQTSDRKPLTGSLGEQGGKYDFCVSDNQSSECDDFGIIVGPTSIQADVLQLAGDGSEFETSSLRLTRASAELYKGLYDNEFKASLVNRGDLNPVRLANTDEALFLLLHVVMYDRDMADGATGIIH